MKSLRLPDAGSEKPEEIPWSNLSLPLEWCELIQELAPGTTPTEIQRICLRDHRMLESRRNLIVSAPTNSGKSLIGYLFLLDAVRRGKRVLLLEPFRALAQEKYEELLDHRVFIEKFLGREFKPKITTGDYSLDQETLASPPPEEGELVIATPERIEVILRHSQYDGWIEGVGAICVDEAHLISDPRRGGTMEFVIASLLSRSSPPRVLLLSATLGDTDAALRWLEPCDLALSKARWPQLHREILTLEGEENPDLVVRELIQGILRADGTSVMIFVYRKGSTIKLAELLEAELGIPVLAYHSNMTLSKKEAVRRAYFSGECHCVVATTALGTGINLPATHLIIRDTTFHPDGKISPAQLHQMMGRAGRGARDGHSMVILRESDDWNEAELRSALVDDPMPALESALLGKGSEKKGGQPPFAAARVVLSLLCRSGESGFSQKSLARFCRSMLAGQDLTEELDDALKWLCSSSALLAYKREEDGLLLPTTLGRAAAQGGLPPDLAAAIGRLLRDLLSIDEDLSIMGTLSGLDLLLLSELVADKRYLGGRFSKELEEKVDNWCERSPEKSVLFRQWIRPRDENARADELFGSLDLMSARKSAMSVRTQGYLRMRDAAVLWMRGQGIPWTDISRRWGIDAGQVSEEEWIRNRSWLLSGIAAILDIRCFYYHLREECEASDEKVAKVKNILRRLRAQCFQLLGRMKYCSPLGPLLTRMKTAGVKGVGSSTIEKLESAGLTTPQAIVELSEEKGRELGIDPKRLGVIRGYLRRR